MTYVPGCSRIVVCWLVSLGVVACDPRVGDGAFACDPDEAGACPAGYACQVRAPLLEHRCYRSLGQSYCGDGVVDPGEACDGAPPDGVTCAGLGYWFGTPRCSDRCRAEGEGCVGLGAVAVGMASTCALDTRGQAWCWGSNSAGVLGTGQTSISAAPMPVATAVPFASLAVALDHACALTPEGAAYCWGNNLSGQLGLGQVTEGAPIPRPVDTTLRFQQLAVGRLSTCGLDPDGRIWCWGAGYVGQLGNGSLDDRAEPVAVQSEVVFTRVVAAMTTFCGLDRDGKAWCWGDARRSQLGDGQPVEAHPVCVAGYPCSPFPVAVAGGERFVDLADGNGHHTCGLDADGGAWCWGYGGTGALGQGDLADHAAPVRVPLPARLAAVAVGLGRTSAVDESGRVWVWGTGATGDGETLDATVPVPVSLDPPAVAVATGWGSTCAVQAPGQLRCWGFGGSGQLGVPSRGGAPRPLQPGSPLDGVAPGLFHTCALDPGGQAHCWGINLYGQLGSWLPTGSLRPVPVVPLEGHPTFTQLAAGNMFTLALTSTGDLGFWGALDFADGSFLFSVEPTVLVGPPTVLVAAGAYHACVVDAEGQAWCWGVNEQGELGSTAVATADQPVAVEGGHRFARLALGYAVSCGIADDGSAWCWGGNSEGQLGAGGGSSSSLPVPVAEDRRYVDLSCGWVHCCGVDDFGGGWCWGANWEGELGSGSSDPIAETPQAVTLPGRFQRIVASYNFTCGLDQDGQAWCWGGSDWGDPVLGNGVVADRFVPVAVATGLRFDDLVSKGWRTCGREPGGAWHCWGGNMMGELGIDDQVLLPHPVEGPDLP